MKAGSDARVQVEACVRWVDGEPSELYFNLKPPYQTQDVGQPSQRREEDIPVSYWINSADGACFERRHFYFKVAFFFLLNQFLYSQPQTSHQPVGAFSPSRFDSIFECNNETSQGIRQQWHVEMLHKLFFFNTRLGIPQITAVISVKDKWERWTWDKHLLLYCCLLIKGLFNPFIIITYSAHRSYLQYNLAPGVYH